MSYSVQAATAQAVAAPEVKQAEQAAPASLHGFELERQQWVAEYNSTVLLYKHTKTGIHNLRKPYHLCLLAQSVIFVS